MLLIWLAATLVTLSPTSLGDNRKGVRLNCENTFFETIPEGVCADSECRSALSIRGMGPLLAVM